MLIRPPNGSKISVITDGDDLLIIIPHTSGDPMRYVGAPFLVIWLGLWAFAFKSDLLAVLSGQGSAFHIVWLVPWMVVGAMAVWVLYRLLSPSIPESIRLRLTSVIYDSGAPPLPFNFMRQVDTLKALFRRRIHVELDRLRLTSVRLRPTDSSNRLTVDLDASRIDIAQAASETEREWLYQLLTQRYSL